MIMPNAQLTPEMRRALVAMIQGAKWHECSCPSCHGDLWNKTGRLGVTSHTMTLLSRVGYVEREGKWDYKLTGKGRAGIAQAD